MPSAATAPRAAAAPRELHLAAPADPTAAELAAFALQVRRAVRQGRRVLVVDEADRSRCSPGHLLVLERLRGLVERCGGRWTAAAGR